MSSSNFYWSQHLVQGFGRMWFLIVPQRASSPGGGESLLGSVVNEIPGQLFQGGLIGKSFPEPIHLTTPGLILKTIDVHRKDLGIDATEPIVQETDFAGVTISVDKKDALKIGVGSFPSLPVAFGIDYSRMVSITIEFGGNTRQKYIPTAYLTRLKQFYKGDDSKIPGSAGVNIDKETIIHQILLTDQYSVTFESQAVFDAKFEVAIQQANIINAGKINFELDRTTKKRVTAKVNDGKEYLIALKDIDWDDF